MRYTLEIDFLEAATGAKKRVTMPDGGVLDLTVPEGVSDGQVLRLKGKGSPGARGSEAGDALVEIKVRPHPQFSRAGDDIALELPITIDEAVLGAKIEVPTVSGRVQLTIPKGTSSGRVFRLKGKGVHNTTTGSTGDQLVTVRIVLPETIDDKLAYFMSEWRQSHRYDPRKLGRFGSMSPSGDARPSQGTLQSSSRARDAAFSGPSRHPYSVLDTEGLGRLRCNHLKYQEKP